MSAVVAGTLVQLQNLLPGQIGTNSQWTSAYIQDVIMLADAAVRERCETYRPTQEISLVADTDTYDLDSSFIEVTEVEWSSDGSTFIDYLTPIDFKGLDRECLTWRDSRASRPIHYNLLSAVGTQETSGGASDGSQIVIYPPPSTVTSETIRVTGVGLGTTTTGVPLDVIHLVYVPWCLSFLFGTKEPRRAYEHWKSFQRGCQIVGERFVDPYTEQPQKV